MEALRWPMMNSKSMEESMVAVGQPRFPRPIVHLSKFKDGALPVDKTFNVDQEEDDLLAEQFDTSDPQAGEKILNAAEELFRRFCLFPNEHCYPAVALWAAHTHCVESFYTTPRLAFLSPEGADNSTSTERNWDVRPILKPPASRLPILGEPSFGVF